MSVALRKSTKLGFGHINLGAFKSFLISIFLKFKTITILTCAFSLLVNHT